MQNKYLSLIKIYFEKSFSKKADAIGYFLINLIAVSSIIFIWFAVIGKDGILNGYTLNNRIIYPKLIINIYRESTTRTLAELIKTLDVEDINIAEPRLEDIVEKLFKH